MLRATLLVITVALGSCIILPVSEPDPYPANLLEELVLDQTSKSEVLELLGQPNIQRDSGNIWIYGKSNREFYALVFDSAGPVHDFQVVILNFDYEVLRSWEKIESFKPWGCSQIGICISHGWSNTNEGFERLMPESSITSVRDDDKKAKRFGLKENMCQLYVYNSSFPPAWWNHDSSYLFRFISVSIGDIQSPLIGSVAYMHTDLGIGGHRLAISLPNLAFGQHEFKEESFEVEVNCNRDELIFLAIVDVHRAKVDGAWRRTIETEFQSSNTGVKEVKKRNLLLLH